MLHDILKRVAPIAALAVGAIAATGCNGNISIGDTDGVPLAELDRSGPAPTELVLAGPDEVSVMEGRALDIAVSGDTRAVEALRFSLEDGKLAIARAKDAERNIGTARVRVTTPGLTAIVLAGSGTVDAERLTGDAGATIAGSGKVRVREVAASKFDLTIAGSGEFEGGGAAETLDLTVAGSGSGRMGALQAARADVSVMGSGSAEFSSDGRVDANIMGSGSVTVNGRADCTVSAMGSGRLDCRGGTVRSTTNGRSDPPRAPTAPDAPAAPSATRAAD